MGRLSRSLPARALRRLRAAALTPLLGTVVGVDTAAPVAALTFDDGPHPRWTPALLDILARHGAKATHFFVGEAVARHPEVAEAAARAGHALGSHTRSHRSLVRLPAAEVEREVAEGHAALGGSAAPLFRPPYGHYDVRVARVVRRLGLVSVGWSAHVDDWRPWDEGELARRLDAALRPGAVVLLHEALYTHAPGDEPDRGALLAALDAVLARRAGELRFVTVPELLELGRPVRALVEKRGEDAFVAAQARVAP